MKVLFFGRKGCDGTSKALTLLRTLGCELTVVNSQRRGENLPIDTSNWTGDFIFSFRSLYVLPKSIIESAAIAAVNFHPAPVEYPGSGCLNFALYENAKNYGVTAHIMNETIDSGPVIECRRFPIFPSDSVDTLLERTHIKLLDLFFDVSADLVINGRAALEAKIRKSSHEKWRGVATRLKDLEKLQVVPIDAPEEEVRRRVRATYTTKFPTIIKLYGYEFAIKPPIETV